MKDIEKVISETTAEGDRIRIKTKFYSYMGQRPHFSTTAELYKRERLVCCGCMHDEILKVRPDLKPLVDLHLSDEDGIPMHGMENGWYWLAGAMGGAGMEYHGWGGSEKRTKRGCLKIFAEHCRISLHEAEGLLLASVLSETPKQAWIENFEARKTIWKIEADAGISLLNSL